ncbi:hypothetical protein L3X38_011605 [Prunus dulcis]|uniref:Uncharacterized protein n=1 Tax=Prunus dulcis TaxID=3755 RepID=A0AAD4WJD2_PRUDU|nr:hypothetical protein L3X38_011605 [Prunus dulcis]
MATCDVQQGISRGVPSVQMVPMGIVHSLSAGIKHLVGVNNKKVNGIHEVRDILLKSPLELLKTHDLPSKEVAEKQGSNSLRGADSVLQVAVKRARESSALNESTNLWI